MRFFLISFHRDKMDNEMNGNGNIFKERQVIFNSRL